MKFFAVLALAGAAVAYTPCSGLSGNAMCCGASVLDVAVLNCASPNKSPEDASDFQSICAASGNSPKCCTLGLAGQGLLCSNPVGVRG